VGHEAAAVFRFSVLASGVRLRRALADGVGTNARAKVNCRADEAEPLHRGCFVLLLACHSVSATAKLVYSAGLTRATARPCLT
jgi:hypothetical protein